MTCQAQGYPTPVFRYPNIQADRVEFEYLNFMKKPEFRADEQCGSEIRPETFGGVGRPASGSIPVAAVSGPRLPDTCLQVAPLLQLVPRSNIQAVESIIPWHSSGYC